MPPVIPATQAKTSSKSTIPPSTYDKHLAEEVVLRRVCYCPKFVPFMVDDLRASLLTLKESAQLTQLTAHRSYSERIRKLRSKQDVGKAFVYSIGYPATDMAAACVNLFQSENTAMEVGIEFDQGEHTHKAVADNVWYLVFQASSSSLGNEEESKRAIAMVEYKSCTVGDAEFFEQLTAYARQNARFQWKFCDTDCTGPKHKITHSTRADDSDAQIVMKITSSVDIVESGSPTDHTLIPSLQQKVMKVLQQVWVQACKYDLTTFMLSTHQRSVFMIRQRKTQTLFVSTVVEKDPSSWNPTEATLAMIHVAYVDWRHRPSSDHSDQISTSIVTDDDLDDQNKEEQDDDYEEPDPNYDKTPSDQPSRKRRGSRKRDSGRRGRQRKKGHEARPADENLTAVLLYFRCGIYQSVRPALLQRRLPSNSVCSTPLSHEISKTQSSDITTSSMPKGWSETPSVFIYALAGEGGGGDVWRAKLVLPNGSKHRVVVKIGREVDLYHEQLAYEHLESHAVAGIPKIWGSFSEVGEDGVTYIILEDAGSPIGSSHVTEDKWMSFVERDNIVKSLNSIHQVGIIHGDIRSPNLLERPSPDGTRIFTIIDFHLATINGGTKGKSMAHLANRFKEELCALEEILKPWIHEGSVIPSHDMVRKE
ncbi:hypothetical protein FRC02_003209 [Tulasnella sp. 418]|nr:hypothetical protein FRC02_003209 [Tulasnella sp. 418]